MIEVTAGTGIAKPIAPFKAYDVRGHSPNELDADFAYRIGQAFAEVFHAQQVVIGRDVRVSGEMLSDALAAGLQSKGCTVLDLGVCGTELIYFAAFSRAELDGGIMVTASHNPKDDNGFKFVLSGAEPVFFGQGLEKIQEYVLAHTDIIAANQSEGDRISVNLWDDYIAHLLTYVDVDGLRPLKIVMDSGNGPAQHAVELIRKHLPAELLLVRGEPDGSFPNGVPNPMLAEQRRFASEAIRAHRADFGVAWDGDFDRCFFFDGDGTFIEGYYIVGLLAESLISSGAQKIIHDPRVYWNTQDICRRQGATALVSQTGHAFIKAAMRKHDADYGGEMSAHHYFKRFGYCDSGMIPWLLVYQLISQTGLSLKALVQEAQSGFPSSGELNFEVSHPDDVIDALKNHYAKEAGYRLDTRDGIDMSFMNWRCSIRMSNTEPLLRLNVETRGDRKLLKEVTHELIEAIQRLSSVPAQT